MLDLIMYSIALWLACGTGANCLRDAEDFYEWKYVMAAGPFALGLFAYFKISGADKD
ncbi:MAG: hypothetical protein P1U50_01050 [Parvibaculaceae bacterium]|nr:hypothetical protein [Parvibaculaceae bacterium]